MKLTELRALAASRGLKGISGLRKGQLVAALSSGAPVRQEPAREQPARPEPTREEPPREESPRPAVASVASEETTPAEKAEHDRDGSSRPNRGRRGRRNRRNRRNREQRDNANAEQQNGHQREPEPEELESVAGILDVVDNNAAFVRTTGYRSAPSDVFVNNNMVRRFDLRSGDAIVGQVKVGGGGHTHGNGRNRRKYNQLVRVDSVNGMHPEEARKRPDFHKLTPLYPNQRLRLETQPNILTTRVIDLVMPIGKGQRALIVSPPKAGKTTILQNIANAIATNNPECYLMVVLVDERPEEVTDMQRSVKGEVIASTFDRPPAEHTAVAELAIERAKRLVEMGKDVVVLLDSITRLGRAYNNSSPASGRILSGGVDSNALYPPKRFLGAARNIEHGGSLTIIATAMVETGSAGDTVIFEEFKGTGNAELKLDRKISERRVFPAVDVNPTGTRKDELLMPPDEYRVMHKLRRILSALDSQAAIDLLIKQLKKTRSNGEFLMQVASSAPMAADKDVEEYL
ncbi:transcription termination factor Rho [Corynebacterium uterequi]